MSKLESALSVFWYFCKETMILVPRNVLDESRNRRDQSAPRSSGESDVSANKRHSYAKKQNKKEWWILLCVLRLHDGDGMGVGRTQFSKDRISSWIWNWQFLDHSSSIWTEYSAGIESERLFMEWTSTTKRITLWSWERGRFLQIIIPISSGVKYVGLWVRLSLKEANKDMIDTCISYVMGEISRIHPYAFLRWWQWLEMLSKKLVVIVHFHYMSIFNRTRYEIQLIVMV